MRIVRVFASKEEAQASDLPGRVFAVTQGRQAAFVRAKDAGKARAAAAKAWGMTASVADPKKRDKRSMPEKLARQAGKLSEEDRAKLRELLA